MAVLFSQVLKRQRRGDVNYNDTTTRDWFRDKAQRAWFPPRPTTVISKRESQAVTKPIIGEMFMFQYDPKHKLTLPYYDSFPLIFPIEMYSDGFLGLNMHYLPPLFRARLMDALYTVISDKRYDEKTRLRISYQTLKGVSKFSYFTPTVHRYLFSHVRSSIVKIDPQEWDYTLFLPLARFQKESQRKVWDDSVRLITEGKR